MGIVGFLTSVMLSTLKAQLGIFVKAHAPQFGQISGITAQ